MVALISDPATWKEFEVYLLSESSRSFEKAIPFFCVSSREALTYAHKVIHITIFVATLFVIPNLGNNLTGFK